MLTDPVGGEASNLWRRLHRMALRGMTLLTTREREKWLEKSRRLSDLCRRAILEGR